MSVKSKNSTNTVLFKTAMILFSAKFQKQNLSKDERNALKTLKFYYVLADKGNATVILYKSSYCKKNIKTLQFFLDCTVYKQDVPRKKTAITIIFSVFQTTCYLASHLKSYSEKTFSYILNYPHFVQLLTTFFRFIC